MSDIKRISDELRQYATKAKPKDQAAMIGTLMQEVANYVNDIAKEQELVKQIDQLRARTKQKAETPEEEDEIRDAQEAYQVAKDAERSISEKRVYLSRLERVTEGLLSEIRRAR